MKSSKILFIMHVSWFWIKQRPQFLAEELSAHIPVTVACVEDYRMQKKLNKLSRGNRLRLVSFFIFLSQRSNSFISRVNARLKQIQLRFLLKSHSIVWFNSPTQFLHLRGSLSADKIVVYDCMDNQVEFLSDPASRDRMKKLESELCQRANHIFTSAVSLEKLLVREYSLNKHVTVINNALASINSDIEVLPAQTQALFADKAKKYISYIGTIAGWFDFAELQVALSKNDNVQINLFGPCDGQLPDSPQIVYGGVIRHSLVNAVMEASDALIMPFKITELVKYVNPVKAYEYISSGKPVILSRYDETVVFEPYAFLYQSADDLDVLLDQLSNDSLRPKKSLEECHRFAKDNTWKSRADKIYQVLQSKEV